MWALFVLCALPLASAQAGYTLNVWYTCTNTSAGFCTAWSQKGTFSPSISCFPPTAVVITPTGPKNMAELQIGDSVLGHDESSGKEEFTRVRAWLHRFPTQSSSFVTLTTAEGEITLSPFHNVAVVDEFTHEIQYVYARDVVEGALLRYANRRPSIQTQDDTTSRVLSTKPVLLDGLFAPLTDLSNLYVGSDAENVFLAHSFAHVSYVRTFAPIVHSAMSLAEWWNPSVHDVHHDEEYIHPVAKNLARLFPMVVDMKPQELSISFTSGSSSNHHNDISHLLFASASASAVLSV